MTKVSLVVALFITVLVLPVDRANAVPCGPFIGNDISVGFNDLTGTVCSYELEYLEGMLPGDPVDLVFTPTAGPGTYTFTTLLVDTVVNSTLFPWDDYHYALGMGVGPAFVQFTAVASPGFGLSSNGVTPFFVNPAQSDVFLTANVSTHTVDFTGGMVPNGPGNLVNFNVNVFVPAVFGSFTLRQNFSVPEPATLLLLALGLAGLVASRRKLN